MESRNRSKTIITVILILIAAILVGVAGALIYSKNQEEAEKRAEREKLMAVQVDNPDMPEDYRQYKADNPDVYAWLYIKGTDISCPVVQNTEDNSYYLSHDANGKESETGAVFTENYNSLTFDDPDTVLYGNSGQSDSVFAPLLEYEDPVYFENHRDITILLPDKTLTYRIFATYIGDDAHLLLNRDLTDQDEFQKYIGDIFKQRGMTTNVDKDMLVTPDNRILTLSTGHPSAENARFIVQAVLVG